MVTTSRTTTAIELAMQAPPDLGADRFLVKPVDFDALAAMIRAVVGEPAAQS